MTRSPISHASRRAAAQAALDALGPSPGAHAILAVRCARAHHVAVVYASPDGLVYAATDLQRHSHGDRDRFDSHHREPGHGHAGRQPWVDFLLSGADPDVDDVLPAGCECGRRTLSRAALAQAIREGERHVVVG
jgi:hypothetical protein